MVSHGLTVTFHTQLLIVPWQESCTLKAQQGHQASLAKAEVMLTGYSQTRTFWRIPPAGGAGLPYLQALARCHSSGGSWLLGHSLATWRNNCVNSKGNLHYILGMAAPPSSDGCSLESHCFNLRCPESWLEPKGQHNWPNFTHWLVAHANSWHHLHIFQRLLNQCHWSVSQVQRQ